MKRCDLELSELDVNIVAHMGYKARNVNGKALIPDGAAEELGYAARYGCSGGSVGSVIYYEDTWRFFYDNRHLLTRQLKEQVEEGLFENANGAVSAVCSFACFSDKERKDWLEEVAAKVLYGRINKRYGDNDHEFHIVANAIVWGAFEDLANRYENCDKEDVRDDE